MLNGNCYSLDTDNGSINGIINIKITDDKDYNWDYYGELNRSIN